MVYTWYSQIDASSKRVIGRVIPEKRGRVFEELCLNNWIGTCSTVLVRHVCFERLGMFDEELASGADYDMWLRISKEFDIDYVPEPLVLYNVHRNRISTNHEYMIRGTEALLRKHARAFALDCRSNSRRYLALGVSYCHDGNTKKGREAFVNGIRLHPFEIRHYYNLCLSLLGAKNFGRLKKFRGSFHVPSMVSVLVSRLTFGTVQRERRSDTNRSVKKNSANKLHNE